MPRSSRAAGWAVLAGAMVATSALANPVIPTQEGICDYRVLNKNKLADYLLENYPLSEKVRLQLLASTAPNPAYTDARRILSALPSGKLCPECSQNDKAHLQDINGAVGPILAGLVDGLKPSNSDIEVTRFFAEADNVDGVTCLVDKNGDPIEPAGSVKVDTPPNKSHWRVRGKAGDLAQDRSSPTFQSLSQATLDISSDQISGTRTTKAVGAIGYDLNLSPSNNSGAIVELIPYAGSNWSISRKRQASGGTINDAKTVDFGLLGTAYWPMQEGTFGNLFTLAADDLLNDIDESKHVSVNMAYKPIVNDGINTFHEFSNSPAGYVLIAGLKADAGFFTDRGINPAANKDFLRLGAEAGFSVSGDPDRFPVTLSASYVYLGAVQGRQDIGDLNASLTYNFTKYLGVTFSYKDGRREDTAAKERIWDVALTGRF